LKERLQKIISRAGIASRRAAEKLILEGQVKVNGKIVRELGTKADVSRDKIFVRGKIIERNQSMLYFAFNKPVGIVSTFDDPEGRKCLKEFIRHLPIKLHSAGRLDYDSEGLLLLTNDGDLTAKLTHPRSKIPKTYYAKIKGKLSPKDIDFIVGGKYKGGGAVGAVALNFLRAVNDKTWWEIILAEGKNRQVRKIFEEAGHDVLRLRRVAIGGLLLGELDYGQLRALSPDEILALKSL
jgi:23S rRNA pseudouridine2605 synthase